MNIGIIEQKRKEKNLTVSKLCDLAGIDRSTYYKILQEPDRGKFSTVSKLVIALKLNAAERSQLLN